MLGVSSLKGVRNDMGAIKMDEQKFAIPGDTVEITFRDTLLFSRQFVVVPKPKSQTCKDFAGDVWVLDEIDGTYNLTGPGHYRIIKRAKTPDTKSVDVFLQEQLDDNLRSLFC